MMTTIKRNYLLHTAILSVAMGVGDYFVGFPLVPLFFFLVGVFVINMTETCRLRMPKRMLQVYLLARVLRMVLAMMVMLVYCVAVRQEVKLFLITFIINYLIYLIYDSWFYFHVESKLKTKKTKTDETIA